MNLIGKFLIGWLLFDSLWAEILVLKDTKKIDCKLLNAVNDSLIVIDYKTGMISKFAIEDVLRVEHKSEYYTDRASGYGFLGGIIGGLAAWSLLSITELDDSRIAIPLFCICISCGIVQGVKIGGH